MEVTPRTYDVVVENRKVLHEFDKMILAKQKVNTFGNFGDVQEICYGKASIVEMSTGALHFVVKDNTYNLMLCDHVISKHMKPVLHKKRLLTRFCDERFYLSWVACDSNKKLVVFHLIPFGSNNETLYKIEDLILEATRLAEKAEKKRTASLNIPGETRPPFRRPESCVTTDVESVCTMTDFDQSDYSDVGDDQSDVFPEENQQLQYKMSAIQSFNSDLCDVTKEESDLQKMAVVLELHARQLKEIAERMEQLEGQERATNATVVKLEALVDQYEAPVKNLMHPMLNMCRQQLMEEMQPADVFQVLQFAQMIDNKPLKECCIRLLQDDTEEVLKADTWVDVSVDFILTLLQQDSLNVDSELTLLSACQHWAAHQPGDDVRQHLDPLLPYLRLRTLTVDNFVDFTMKHEIFTAQEKFQLLGCISKPEMTMPEGFCNTGTPRTNQSNGLANRLAGKSVCAMDLVPTGVAHTHTSAVQILISKDTILHGVCLQALPVDAVNAGQHYTTTVNVSIGTQNNASNLVYHTFQGKVKYGGCFDVCFPQPCLMNSGAYYYIVIYYPDKVARPVNQLQGASYPGVLGAGNYNLCSVSKMFYLAC